MNVLKLLSVNSRYYEALTECTPKQGYVWQAFKEEDACNLWLNGYVLMCVPEQERFINPYYEYVFSVECTYMKRLDQLLQRHPAMLTMSAVHKYDMAHAIIQQLDQEASRRGLQFRSDVFDKKQMLGQCVDQQQWDAVDRAFLETQKQDIVQLLHLMNAQHFLERVVQSLLLQHEDTSKK